jgi:hypothetical protein
MVSSFNYVLTDFTFIAASAGPQTGPSFRCDWRFAGSQERTLQYSAAASAGTINIQTAMDFDVSGSTVWATVTSISVNTGGATSGVITLNQPFKNLRATITGAGSTGAVTVRGLV